MTDPAVHGVHERPAAAAEELGQQHASHGPDPCKVVQDDRCGDEPGPQAVERDIRQQDEGFCRQRAEVDRHPHRMDGHPDHVMGIQRTEGEHQTQSQEGRIRRADGAPPLDEEVVHDAVAHCTGEHGPQAVAGFLVDDIDAVQKLVVAAAGGRQRQERHEVPGVIIVRLHDVHDRTAEPDDARRAAEQHTGIGAEDLGEEPGAPVLFRHGGELPGIVEDEAQRREDGGQEVAGGEQAAPGVAAVAVQPVAHLTHEEQVRRIDDPEADLGRDHGQREAKHLLPQVFVQALQLHKVPELSGQAEEEHTDQVAADDGQQVAVGPPVEPHQIQRVERHGRHRAEHTVHGHQLVPLAAAHELGAQGAQAAHEDIDVDEQAVLCHIGQKLRDGPAEHQDAETAQDGQQAVGEHLLFTVALVQAEPDDGVGHAHRHERDEQIGVLAQDLRKAKVGDLRHGIGQKRLDQQGQQLRRKT